MNRRDRRALEQGTRRTDRGLQLPRLPEQADGKLPSRQAAAEAGRIHYLLERDDGGPESLSLEQIRLLNSAGR